MQVKLLRQAAGRDDRIVAAYEDVTFLNEHVGWYPIIKDRFRKANDIVVVVLRVGDVCFEAGSMFRRGMLRKEYIEARTAEARNLRAAVQRRMASCQWIPSSYVAAYEALGWDARPLKGHRTRMRELYAAEDRRREQVRIEREMTTAARGSAAENVIETGRGCFSGGRIRRNGTLYCLVRQIWDQYPPPDARHAAKTDCRFIPNADPLQRREPRFPYLVVARMPRIDRSLGGKTKIDFQIFTL